MEDGVQFKFTSIARKYEMDPVVNLLLMMLYAWLMWSNNLVFILELGLL